MIVILFILLSFQLSCSGAPSSSSDDASSLLLQSFDDLLRSCDSSNAVGSADLMQELLTACTSDNAVRRGSSLLFGNSSASYAAYCDAFVASRRGLSADDVERRPIVLLHYTSTFMKLLFPRAGDPVPSCLDSSAAAGVVSVFARLHSQRSDAAGEFWLDYLSHRQRARCAIRVRSATASHGVPIVAATAVYTAAVVATTGEAAVADGGEARHVSQVGTAFRLRRGTTIRTRCTRGALLSADALLFDGRK
jgi:hypothetical protein